ncbi:MAG: hypothetical protein LBM62_08335 [Mediterranea sp.]|jgi:hypothetical protein|nr:hypothetical protein [Mediterranea sp.]
MRRTRRLQQRIVNGRYTLFVALFIATLCWVPGTIVAPPHLWKNHLISYLVYVCVAYLLILLNNAFGIIRTRATVQATIYVLLMAVCIPLHADGSEAFVSLMYLLSMFFLFRSYQQPLPATDMFYSFLFLGIGSYFFPQLTLLAPLLWMGAYLFRSLTWKSFWASIVGWFVPYWFILMAAVWKDDLSLFCRPFEELITFQPPVIGNFRLWESVTLAYLLILFLIAAVYILTGRPEGKIRTRSYLHFFILTNLCLFAYVLFQPGESIWVIPLLAIGNSVLGAHYFTDSNSVVSNILFVATLIGLGALFVYNLWMLG